MRLLPAAVSAKSDQQIGGASAKAASLTVAGGLDPKPGRRVDWQWFYGGWPSQSMTLTGAGATGTGSLASKKTARADTG